ncbi:MAG: hypothetical protein AAGG46_12890, partial [Planctomycetota bacterium]
AFVAGIGQTLTDIQQGLYDRSHTREQEAVKRIDSLAAFEKFFADGSPGGLAYSPFTDGPAMESKCKELKVTPRCVPLGGEAFGETAASKCLFIGEPTDRWAVFARAY